VVRGDDSGIETRVTSPATPDSSVLSDVSSRRRTTASGATCTYDDPGSGGQVFDETRDGVTGRYYFRTCNDGSSSLVWIPASAASRPGARAVTVTPGQLAQRAVDRLPLPAPAVRHSPDRVDGRPGTVVGVRTWWWVDSASFGAITHTVRAGPVWARVTARPVETYWEPGSAGAPSVRCAGSGTPYDPTRPVAAQRTDCFTVYARSSADQPQRGPSPNDRFFTAAVTVTWRVSWVGAGGRSGALPALTRRTTFPIAVAEVQTVNE
jgi:hypothetical protein